MPCVILKPNENEDWPVDQRSNVTVNAKKIDREIRVPCEAFVFRKNSTPSVDDGHLYAKANIVGATAHCDGKWSFELEIIERPSTPLLSQELDQNVIDKNDGAVCEIAEVRRISWTRFFEVSDAVADHLKHNHFGA